MAPRLPYPTAPVSDLPKTFRSPDFTLPHVAPELSILGARQFFHKLPPSQPLTFIYGQKIWTQGSQLLSVWMKFNSGDTQEAACLGLGQGLGSSFFHN